MIRNAYFDFLRDIAIIMVISIHPFTTNDSINIRQILNSAVPIFIAVSGFFLSSKDLSHKDQYLKFLKKQVLKVYVPTIIGSLSLLLLTLYTDGINISNILFMFICGFSIYYFIAFIMQYYILLPIVSTFCINLLSVVNNN